MHKLRKDSTTRFTFFGDVPRQYVGTERESESEERRMRAPVRSTRKRSVKQVQSHDDRPAEASSLAERVK